MVSVAESTETSALEDRFHNIFLFADNWKYLSFLVLLIAPKYGFGPRVDNEVHLKQFLGHS